MSWNRYGLAGLLLLLTFASAYAGGAEALKGKFAYDWIADPSSQKCAKVAGQLLADFKSAKYRCDLNKKSTASNRTNAAACAEKTGHKEYLVFDTLRACEVERESQSSGE